MGRTGGSGRTETMVDESRKETADRVARYQTDYVEPAYSMLLVLQTAAAASKLLCCASVFLPFPFALGRIMFMLYHFVLSVTSPGGHDPSFLFLFFYYSYLLLCSVRFALCQRI